MSKPKNSSIAVEWHDYWYCVTDECDKGEFFRAPPDLPDVWTKIEGVPGDKERDILQLIAEAEGVA